VTADSRAPIPPAEAESVFGTTLDKAQQYAELLATTGVERGLLGPREVPRLWTRHLLNCAVVAELIPSGSAVDDIGSGAGLPGIVLALIRPDLEVTLVEPLLRRATFLGEAVAQLGLPNTEVVRARAEDRATGGARADVVTARAVAPLDRLAAWCLPLVRQGGSLLALKGESAADELAIARPALQRYGGAQPRIVIVGAGVVDPPTTVVVVDRVSSEAKPRGRTRGGR
jgi:16S rRNA (guanine527-N7)-methyltransferase